MLYIDDAWFWVLIFVIRSAAVLIMISVTIVIRNYAKGQKNDESDAEFTDEEPLSAVASQAVVSGKYSEILHTGSYLTPDFRIAYLVEFITDDSTAITYEVPIEVFDRVKIGQMGTLVTVDGSFFAFDEGEDTDLDDSDI